MGTTTANAKSVLSVLGACVKSGDEIEFVCDGPDEKEALGGHAAAGRGGLWGIRLVRPILGDILIK